MVHMVPCMVHMVQLVHNNYGTDRYVRMCTYVCVCLYLCVRMYECVGMYVCVRMYIKTHDSELRGQEEA